MCLCLKLSSPEADGKAKLLKLVSNGPWRLAPACPSPLTPSHFLPWVLQQSTSECPPRLQSGWLCSRPQLVFGLKFPFPLAHQPPRLASPPPRSLPVSSPRHTSLPLGWYCLGLACTFHLYIQLECSGLLPLPRLLRASTTAYSSVYKSKENIPPPLGGRWSDLQGKLLPPEPPL